MAKEHFNIVLVQPGGFLHVMVFHDLAHLLAASLESLGHSASIQINKFVPTAVNIVLGYQLYSTVDVLRKLRWIPYQLEQLSPKNPRMKPRWLAMLSQAHEIWDYDLSNIAYLKSQGIETARHVPIGFHEKMRTVAACPLDIDVLHYGSVSERRVTPILTALEERCKFQQVFGVYGPERDELIARAKIVLNVHRFEAEICEQARISYLLNNGKCVVTEGSAYNPYQEMVAVADYDKIVDRCLELLADDAQRRQIATDGAQRFEKMPMTEILKGIWAESAN